MMQGYLNYCKKEIRLYVFVAVAKYLIEFLQAHWVFRELIGHQ